MNGHLVRWRAYWVDALGVARPLCRWSSYAYANDVGWANRRLGAMLERTSFPGDEP